MVKRHTLDQLTETEQEQLAILRQALHLAKEHRSELSTSAVANTNPIHVFIELVQHKWLDKKDFEKLMGKGSFSRWVLGPSRRGPEDSEAMSHLRHLRGLLKQELWRQVDSGERPHPLDLGKRK